MFFYNLKLAVLNLKTRWVLTLLMILSISIGLALLTLENTQHHHRLNAPLPHLSESLYLVQLDNRGVEAEAVDSPRRLGTMTYTDATNLLYQQSPASAQLVVYQSSLTINNPNAQIHPWNVNGAATTKDFFSMFNAPFLYGGPWSAEDDSKATTVIVLSKKANNYFFSGENSVGKQITLNTHTATIIGVLDDWNLGKRFYDRSYSNRDNHDFFMPFNTAISLAFTRNGWLRCLPRDAANWQLYRFTDIEALKNSECSWINFWIKAENQTQVKEYHAFINRYVNEQKDYGRFPRENKHFITNINQQIKDIFTPRFSELFKRILAYLFFIVCLINSISILLAKFLSRSKEASLRRALGASRRAIILQHLIEVLLIAVIGAIIGIVLSYFLLQGMLQVEWWRTDYRADFEVLKLSFELNWPLILMAFLIATLSTLVIALIPILRVANRPPASELKSS